MLSHAEKYHNEIDKRAGIRRVLNHFFLQQDCYFLISITLFLGCNDMAVSCYQEGSIIS